MQYWELLVAGTTLAILIVIFIAMMFNILTYKLLKRRYKIENDRGKRGDEETVRDGESDETGVRDNEPVEGRGSIPAGSVEETRSHSQSAYRPESIIFKK